MTAPTREPLSNVEFGACLVAVALLSFLTTLLILERIA